MRPAVQLNENEERILKAIEDNGGAVGFLEICALPELQGIRELLTDENLRFIVNKLARAWLVFSRDKSNVLDWIICTTDEGDSYRYQWIS